MLFFFLKSQATNKPATGGKRKKPCASRRPRKRQRNVFINDEVECSDDDDYDDSEGEDGKNNFFCQLISIFFFKFKLDSKGGGEEDGKNEFLFSDHFKISFFQANEETKITLSSIFYYLFFY